MGNKLYYWARKKYWQERMPLTASLQQICNLMKCGMLQAEIPVLAMAVIVLPCQTFLTIFLKYRN